MTEQDLSRLGQFLRDAQDRVPPSERECEVGARLCESRRLKPLRRRAVLWVAGVTAAAGVLSVWLATSKPASLTFDAVASGGPKPEAGAWFAPRSSPQQLAFSDGSKVLLERNAQARVERLEAKGARVLLECGRLEADIAHRGRADWSFSAGPFSVAVTGTRFSLEWDPSRQRLDLAMKEGSVKLSGPAVGDDRRVLAGERLAVLVPEGRVDVADHGPAVQPQTITTAATASPPADATPPTATPTPAQAPSSKRSRTERVRSVASASGSASAPPDVPPSPSWVELARRGRHGEALAAARAKGLDGLYREGSPEDLRVLGDAARLAGDAQVAEQAFSAIRRRFAGSAHAADAAFFLGKLAFDERHRPREASEWFAMCLRERPSGPFARESAGRLIETLRANGDRDDSRRAARQYLLKYPDGPHAEVARQVAEQ